MKKHLVLIFMIGLLFMANKLPAQNLISVNSYAIDTVYKKLRLDIKLDDIPNFSKLVIKAGHNPNSASVFHLHCPVTFSHGDYYVNVGPEKFVIINKNVSIWLEFNPQQFTSTSYVTVHGVGPSIQTGSLSTYIH